MMMRIHVHFDKEDNLDMRKKRVRERLSQIIPFEVVRHFVWKPGYDDLECWDDDDLAIADGLTVEYRPSS